VAQNSNLTPEMALRVEAAVYNEPRVERTMEQLMMLVRQGQRDAALRISLMERIVVLAFALSNRRDERDERDTTMELW